MINPDIDKVVPTYFQHEAWFEVNRGQDVITNNGIPKIQISKPYILIINSYGRLRKLYTNTGRYEDVSDGGVV